ncbi:MAG: hypothetical protein OQK82_08745 [Candidatus Pacearchaeota archaeon]|nr:hypothetical protein [Candidatus Pacearchaeota archaeon]
MKNEITCKGCYALGTACGKCYKCLHTDPCRPKKTTIKNGEKFQLYDFEVLIRHKIRGDTMYLPVSAYDSDSAVLMVEGALSGEDEDDFQWAVDSSREAICKGQAGTVTVTL